MDATYPIRGNPRPDSMVECSCLLRNYESPKPKLPSLEEAHHQPDHASQIASLLENCHYEVSMLDNGKFGHQGMLSIAQQARIRMFIEHLDRVMQEKMEERRQLKKSQVTLWMMINTIGMSNCVPEVKQWTPIVRDLEMGHDMVNLVQKPLHKKNYQLERKIANQRLPPSSTWIILEALCNWKAVNDAQRGLPHECLKPPTISTILEWTLEHGDQQVRELFNRLIESRK